MPQGVGSSLAECYWDHSEFPRTVATTQSNVIKPLLFFTHVSPVALGQIPGVLIVFLGVHFSLLVCKCWDNIENLEGKRRSLTDHGIGVTPKLRHFC